jgi:glycosyltransferase involved in cell wall biosynthesis
MAPLFDRMHFRSLRKAQVILAAADEPAIEGLVARSKGVLTRKAIVGLPTVVDTGCFYPISREESRSKLGLGGEFPIIVASGRVSQAKGWRFLLDAFRVFRKSFPESRFMFVGDGEDRSLLSDSIDRYGLGGSVRICGFQPPEKVSQYLNAADLAVVGSEKEGWCTSIVEALACGKAVVSTDVSGARDLIQDGRNGFVVPQRDPVAFSDAMAAALSLPLAGEISLSIASQYSLANMGSRLRDAWEPLRQTG